jgi:hypothetical protein
MEDREGTPTTNEVSMKKAKQIPFSRAKMEHILALSQSCNNQQSDELAVYSAIQSSNQELFTEAELTITAFCAEECRRQQSGPLSVYRMVAAWNLALELSLKQGNLFTEENVFTLAAILEPSKNHSGYRQVNVSFANGQSLGWQNIPRQMRNLIAALEELPLARFSPNALYEELETIHPLLDGNGRLGKILFNWRNNTLLAPIFPKEPLFMR